MTLMSARTIGLGIALIALGVIVTLVSDTSSVTSLIPAFVGIVFLILGVIAAVREDLRRHVMHGAAAVALIMIVASLGSLISRWSDSSGLARFSQIASAVLCAGFLMMAIQSFKAARSAGKEAKTAARDAALG